MTPASAVSEWSARRDAWLDTAAEALGRDPGVAGWGLVGSFGRGEADGWSDLDLLVVRDEDDFHRFTGPGGNELWSAAELFIDARRNAPAGATSAATVHLRDGLPIGVDWYVYPRHLAAWPSDCDVRLDRRGLPHAGAPFTTWNDRGPRGTPLDVGPDELASARLAMVLVAGKYIARRSALARPILEAIGVPTVGADRTRWLEDLDRLVVRTAADRSAALAAAIGRYLALVASAIA